VSTDYDFSGPFVSAAIISDPKDESSRFPLWMFNTPKSQSFITSGRAELNGLKALAYLTDVSVKNHLGEVPTITAVLSPPFEAARLLLESNIILYGKSILQVSLGYTSGTPSGAVLQTFEGVILKPDITIGMDTTVTINAQGAGGLFTALNTSTQQWEKKTPLEILDDVFKRTGKLEVDSSDIKGAELALLKKATPSESQAGMSDWFFANQLCKRAGCWGMEVGKKFKIISKNDAAGAKPEWKFNLFDFPGGKIGPKNGVFPILGFSTPTMAVFLTSAAKAIRALGTDSKTRKEVKLVVNDAKADVKATDDKPVGIKADQPKAGEEHLLSIDSTAPEAKDILAEEYKTARMGMGVTIEIETMGLPDLEPGQLIQVNGVAKERIDGKYVVMTLEHSIGSGGFTTKFTAVTNTAQLSLKTGDELAAKQPNAQVINEAAPEASLSPKGGSQTVEAKPAT